MAGRVEARLAQLDIQLPPPAPPAAHYVPWVVSGDLVHVAGQIPALDGQLHYVGKLGRDMSIEDGQAAARMVALNLLAQVQQAAGGDLDRVVRVVKLNGFVNCTPDFGDQPKVINGASDLICAILGDEVGQHARAAVGVAALPFGVAVEIDGIFQLG